MFTEKKSEPVLYIFDLHPRRLDGTLKFNHDFAKKAAEDFAEIAKERIPDKPGPFIDYLYAFSAARGGKNMVPHAITMITKDTKGNSVFLNEEDASKGVHLTIGPLKYLVQISGNSVNMQFEKHNGSRGTYEFSQDFNFKYDTQSETLDFRFEENDVLVGYVSIRHNSKEYPVYIFQSLTPESFYLFFREIHDGSTLDEIRSLMRNGDSTTLHGIKPHG